MTPQEMDVERLTQIRQGILNGAIPNMTAPEMNRSLGLWFNHGPFHSNPIEGESCLDWLRRAYPTDSQLDYTTIGRIVSILA